MQRNTSRLRALWLTCIALISGLCFCLLSQTTLLAQDATLPSVNFSGSHSPRILSVEWDSANPSMQLGTVSPASRWSQSTPSTGDFDRLFALIRFLGRLWVEHSYLRSGSWDTFIADDAGLYVFGRKDESGAGIIAVNPSPSNRTLSLELAGYLPWGATLIDAASGQTKTVSLRETIPPMNFRIWHTEEGIDLTPPAPPVIDSVSGANGEVILMIAIPPQTSRVVVRRSLVDGGFVPVGMIDAPDRGKMVTFVDKGVSEDQPTYYQAAVFNDVGLLGEPSVSVQVISHTDSQPASVGDGSD